MAKRFPSTAVERYFFRRGKFQPASLNVFLSVQALFSNRAAKEMAFEFQSKQACNPLSQPLTGRLARSFS
ncbi:hypothetical protein [Poseidonocella sedimentorum]|uniref:hypothetical protein n=1 Tax=Poseidonocella sedimentorum TaxID=871652 RepID=UPI001160BBF5|nr:hypothetical protein [Poseidonocella sedimentorum]